jgi:DNA-binding FadR family transcriptional regulator
MSKISTHSFVEFLARDSVDTATIESFSHGAMRRRTLADNVAMRISHLVKVGNLRAGDVLPIETKMAEALGISRPVLREALKMLTVLGVVESRQGGANTITDLTPKTLMKPIQFLTQLKEYDPVQHYEARSVLDRQLTRLACLNATSEDVQRILDFARRGVGLEHDPIAFRLLDFEFHSAVNEAAGNVILLCMSQSLYELGLNWRRRASEISDNIRTSVIEHIAIAEAIRDGDPDRAEAAQDTHISSILRTTLEVRSMDTQVRDEWPDFEVNAGAVGSQQPDHSSVRTDT